MTAIERNIRKDNPQKIPDEVFDQVKNDIPIPEKYQNMDQDDLTEGITANEIPIVFLDFGPSMSSSDTDLDFTLYYPGKQPISYLYADKEPKWPQFLKRLNKIGKDAKREHYPVMVFTLWSLLYALDNVRKPDRLTKKKTCVWCGKITDTPAFKPNGKYNRPKAFCCKDCQNKYQNFRYLLRTLVRDGKITTFEQELRLNPAYSVIDDTCGNSYMLVHELVLGCYNSEELDEMQENEKIPLISDKNFIVTSDNNVVFEEEDRVCDNCGAHISGHGRRRFCSDKCRFDHHNEKKKLGK